MKTSPAAWSLACILWSSTGLRNIKSETSVVTDAKQADVRVGASAKAGPEVLTGAPFKEKEVNPGELARSYSSVWNGNPKGTGHARSALDSPQGWSAQYNQIGEWMQMDLGAPVEVFGIITQMRRDHNQAVTNYTVAHSSDGVTFTKLPQSFLHTALDNRDERVVAQFSSSFSARFVRLVVQGWLNHASMRAAVLAKAEPSNPGELARTYSTVWNHSPPGAGYARSMLDSPQAWSALHRRTGEWMQMDLGKTMIVGGIVTQMRKDGPRQAVTNYTVAYSSNGLNFFEIPETFAHSELDDRDAKVEVTFTPTFLARYVRVVVQGWKVHPSMRAALLAEDLF